MKSAPNKSKKRNIPRHTLKKRTTSSAINLIFNQPRRAFSTNGRKIVTNNVFTNFEDSVGNTGLIKLKFASEVTGCNIYGKMEYQNSGGSVKDRAALYLIKGAEERGELIPGKPGIIVEASAGNTAIGLNSVANSRGYRTVIVIPSTQTEEKKATLRATGAYLIESDAYPFKDQRNYVHVARRLSQLLTKALAPYGIPVVYTNQWDNTDNARAHEETTGPEIYHQMKTHGMEVDAFSCAIGTGGSIVGTSRALRKLNPNVKIAITDPLGALPVTYYQTGELKMGQGSSITEGIGQSRVTGNLALDNWRPDMSFEISDVDALNVLNRLNLEEGLQVGLSSGINVAGAIRVAQELGPGKNIVTLLCDSASRYGSKMYNIPFLQSKGLPIPYWMDSGIISGKVTSDKRAEYNIPDTVSLLPDLIGGVDIAALVDEAKNNVDMKL